MSQFFGGQFFGGDMFAAASTSGDFFGGPFFNGNFYNNGSAQGVYYNGPFYGGGFFGVPAVEQDNNIGGGSSKPARRTRRDVARIERPLPLAPRKTRDGRTIDPRTLRPVADETPAQPQPVEAQAETMGEPVRSPQFDALEKLLTIPPAPQDIASAAPDYSDDEAILLLLA